MIKYKFNEDLLLAELKAYIDTTYAQHYGANIQPNEVILARGDGIPWFLGNIEKYSNRYGKKGTPSDYRKDLQKVLHYAILALHAHDEKYLQKAFTSQ